MPYRGSKVKKLRGVLKLIHGNYLIYYRVNEGKKTVEVLSFKHGARMK
jgi:plasmid stabilization system protein ParE